MLVFALFSAFVQIEFEKNIFLSGKGVEFLILKSYCILSAVWASSVEMLTSGCQLSFCTAELL